MARVRAREALPPVAAPTAHRSSRTVLVRFARYRLAMIGLLIVGLLAAAGAFAPVITPVVPSAITEEPLRAPTRARLMGTDNLGRDVFSQFLFGARVTLMVAVSAVLISTVTGTIVGMVAGYYGGLADELLMRSTEFFQVIPRFLLAILLAAVFGASLWSIILVIGGLSWPLTARLVRAEYLTLRKFEFVEAARAVGASDGYIMWREILPNALPPIVVNTSLEVGRAILLEAGLSFIGLGDPERMSWGTMLHNAQPFLRHAWWMMVFPGVGISLAVWAINIVGDGVNSALSPRS